MIFFEKFWMKSICATVCVILDMEIDLKKPRRRWREPLSKHISKLGEHLDIFMRGRGSCNHFHRMDSDLMRETINLQINLWNYNNKYIQWIKENVHRNPERFMPTK